MHFKKVVCTKRCGSKRPDGAIMNCDVTVFMSVYISNQYHEL